MQPISLAQPRRVVHVLLGVGAAGAIGGFGVDGDAAEEDGLAVEEDLGAAGLDGLEAEFFVDGVADAGLWHGTFEEAWAVSDVDFVELRGLGRPGGELWGGQRDRRTAGGVEFGGDREVQFRNLHGDGVVRDRTPSDLHPTFDLAASGAVEVEIVGLDIGGGNVDQGEVAG